MNWISVVGDVIATQKIGKGDGIVRLGKIKKAAHDLNTIVNSGIQGGDKWDGYLIMQKTFVNDGKMI